MRPNLGDKKITFKCYWCGQDKVVYKSQHPAPLFCSRECTNAAREFVMTEAIEMVNVLREANPNETLRGY
jgi:hypothetical protein